MANRRQEHSDTQHRKAHDEKGIKKNKQEGRVAQGWCSSTGAPALGACVGVMSTSSNVSAAAKKPPA